MIILNISLVEALKIALNSIILLFIVLIVLMIVVSLFKYIPKVDALANKQKKKASHSHKYTAFDEMDEDMQVAVLTATICYKNEIKNDVKLKSVRKL
jgi:predicted Holliday junction resolvase-like endonuclease